MLQPRFGSIQSQICIQIWILCQRNAKKRRKIKKHKKWKKIKFCIQSPSSFHIPIFQKKSCLVGYLHIVYFNSWTIIFLILESFTLSSWAFLLSIPFIIFLLVFKFLSFVLKYLCYWLLELSFYLWHISNWILLDFELKGST